MKGPVPTDSLSRRGIEMSVLHTIRNYLFYCGIEKDEYNAVKKDAYVSNYRVWRVLHFVMAAVFAALFVSSMFTELMRPNRVYYLSLLLYSIAAICLFYVLKKDSILAQFLIYASITALFLFGCAITRNRPDAPAVTFIAFLLITPMFMIDKPFYMTLVLLIASTVFLGWMRSVKLPEIWRIDCGNVIPFTVVGIILHIIANSIRIREFVLTRTINIQKDTDELTGLKNKAALTREINGFLADGSGEGGIMLLLDIDRFKSINDTYGHPAGDRALIVIADAIRKTFRSGDILLRLGGDEFAVFAPGIVSEDAGRPLLEGFFARLSDMDIPELEGHTIKISMGAAFLREDERIPFKELYSRADKCAYQSKEIPGNSLTFYK